jgi:hypothetical protein
MRLPEETLYLGWFRNAQERVLRISKLSCQCLRVQRASLESISTVEVIPSDSLASVNDCQQRHQTRVQSRRVINSDSWELDVAGVNRHLLKIVLLHDFQLPNWADDDHLRLPTSKNLWLVHRR